MIYYLVKKFYADTMTSYLNSWGQVLRKRIRIIPYENLPFMRLFPGGTYIFSDLDRLSPLEMKMAGQIYQRLKRNKQHVYNDPERAMQRYQLLRTLHQCHINDYDICRLNDPLPKLRFPIFVREENNHDGPTTQLIYDEKQLAQIKIRSNPRRPFLMIEYCDTADGNGVFRKYAAFAVGKRIIPRHIAFSRHWVVKYPPQFIEPDMLEEERAYLSHNPHQQQLREIFAMAHIEYGRIDYSVVNGRLQVWEINTNPIVMYGPHQFQKQHMEIQQYFAGQMQAALFELDCDDKTVVHHKMDIALRQYRSYRMQIWLQALQHLIGYVPRIAKALKRSTKIFPA